MKGFFGVIVLVFCCIPLRLFGQSEFDLEKEIQVIMDKYDAVGAAISVVKNNAVIYTNTFGYNPDYEHPERRDSIPHDGVFWLASVSKSFLSTAIMQLQEKRMLSLDDDINKYLTFKVINPDYPTIPITIRMLLQHRSSLNDDLYSRNFDSFTTTDMEQYKKQFDKVKPGDKYHYCNTGYTLIAAIIENVTQMRIDEYIDKNILQPLAINGTFNMTLVEDEKVVRSMRYDETKKQLVSAPSVYRKKSFQHVLDNYILGESTAGLIPAGGMRISIEGLARFMKAQMNYGRLDGVRILRKRSIKTMWAPQTENNNYGLAISSYPNIIRGKTLVGMRGASHGVHSIMVFDPQKKYGFVVINNGYNTDAEGGNDMNYSIVRALYRYFIEE